MKYAKYEGVNMVSSPDESATPLIKKGVNNASSLGRPSTPLIKKTEISIIPDGKIPQGWIEVSESEYLAQQAEKERERIQSLSMTRSDFFDGTIKAFGVGQDELLVAIETVLAGLEITDVDKKVALNNYKNALNFYRQHPLFTMLTDVEIPLGVNNVSNPDDETTPSVEKGVNEVSSLDEETTPPVEKEGVSITISSEQWDRFFDETDKGNPEAYKELLPIPAEEQGSDTVEGVNNVSSPDEETTPPVEKGVNEVSGSDEEVKE